MLEGNSGEIDFGPSKRDVRVNNNKNNNNKLASVWSYRAPAVTTKEVSGTEKKLFLGTIIIRRSSS